MKAPVVVGWTSTQLTEQKCSVHNGQDKQRISDVNTCADVLGLLLRVQADQKPLSAIVSEVIERHGSNSAAGNVSNGQRSNAQRESSPSFHQPMDVEAPTGETAVKRQKGADGGKRTSQMPEITAADTSKRKVPPSAHGVGESLSRKRGRENAHSGREQADQQGSKAAWAVLQRLKAVAKGEVKAHVMMSDQDDAGDADKDKAGIRDLFRAINNLPGKNAS